MDKPLSSDVATGPDLNRTNVDFSQYSKEKMTHDLRIRKKRSSVMIINLKQQMQKDMRLLTNLCSHVRTSVTPSKKKFTIPPLLQIDSDLACQTPMRNEALKGIPVRAFPKAKTPSSMAKSFKIQPRKTKKSMTIQVKNPAANKRKRVFRVSEQIEVYKLKITQKLRKRSLNSLEDFAMFDCREILNITNGDILK